MEKFSHSDAVNFKLNERIPNGLHTIWMNGFPVDVLLDLKPNRPIVFFLNGAIVQSPSLKLPVFAGLSVVPSGEVSRVYFNDPSLCADPSLALGWYAGMADLKLQKELPSLMQKIIVQAGASKVMFVGGSGGVSVFSWARRVNNLYPL
ncbi:hypothetical protein, partial [Alcaligenes aquatilis]|uniref:hypothetical protein n=1 Tax=Alcaligenes aquatilis TaxID=323284 RepID=UPI003F8DF73A